MLDIKWDKILLVGNRGHKNMGDEIILIGLIKLLLKQWKEIYVATTNKIWLEKFHRQFLDTKNITYIMELPKGFRSLGRFIKNFKDIKHYFTTDTVIVGGGEILTEETSYCRIYWFMSIWISLIAWKKLYLMGGIQIPKKIGNKLLYKLFTKKSEHIYARDYDTVRELQADGVKNVSFFMDTSFFLKDNLCNNIINSKKENNCNYKWNIKNLEWKIDSWNKLMKDKKKKFVVINLNRKGEQYYDNLVKKTKKYIQDGYIIYYVPICKSPSDDDMRFYKKLYKLFPNMKLLDWETDFRWFINKLSFASDVITPRLHLFLVSSYLSIDMEVFEYQRKILKMKKVLACSNKN